MPSKQRRRVKRRTFAKLRNKRKKETSELIETIDGNPIFTAEDFEDDRIAKLLQQKQESNYADDEERDIFLTDLLDVDSNDDEGANDDAKHQQMLENIFGSQTVQQPTVMGSQLTADPLDIQANAADLQYLVRRKKSDSGLNLSQRLNELDDAQFQAERVTMSDMMETLSVPMAKSAAKQINTFDDNQELQRLKLAAQTKITRLNVARKERGLQMDRTRKEMQNWSQAVSVKKDKLKSRRNLIPPRNNMTSFMENMEWNGDLGKELQSILDDYTKDHDLNTALKRHKPSRQEVVKQSKKMAAMRRQIANQIKDFKRIKKIKSRSFRKRLRARKAKVTPSLEELQEIDPKLYHREVKKLLRQRAEERMTLRHKNSSKWAINIVRRGKDGKMDMNSRKALMEQLQRGKELKRRIKGMDSDDDDDDIEDPIPMESASNTNAFETEVEAEQKKKEKYITDAKDKGIWNMKFMKQAEDKRRADIQSLTESATRVQSFKELDDLERSVHNIEKSAYHINPLINDEDDPIGAAKHGNWLKKQQKLKHEQIEKAQTILGKRKFGFTENMEPAHKRMKRKVLDMGEKAKIVHGTQSIEESVFGKGSKSVMRVDVEDEDKGGLVTNNALRTKAEIEPVFEMVEFPKHNDRKKNISQINKEASKDVDRREIKGMQRMNTGGGHKIKYQKYYLHDITEADDANEEDQDGWKVLLDGKKSVHSVCFGTLAADVKDKEETQTPKEIECKELEIETEDVTAFLSESEESEQDEDMAASDTKEDEDIEIKSILKRTEYQSIASDKKKRIKWTANQYSDGNPNTKYHVRETRQITDTNPWLVGLNGTKKKGPKANGAKRNKEQKETTKFDPKKILIPQTLQKTPDFNLLDNNDPKQVEMMYKALSDKNTATYASFTENDTARQEFKQLKESVIEDAMPNAIEGPLRGWDHWTGYGIENDGALQDDEYLQARALHEKKKRKLIESRSDGHLRNVILSDHVSKASSKYLMKWQPDWVNLGMYRTKMNDTMGREWNLSTEFFDTIRPEYDIPHGYIINPTQKEDGKDTNMTHKTKFGKQDTNKQPQQTLRSVYKGNVKSHVAPKRVDNGRPERAKA
eukprot:264016_1